MPRTNNWDLPLTFIRAGLFSGKLPVEQAALKPTAVPQANATTIDDCKITNACVYHGADNIFHQSHQHLRYLQRQILATKGQGAQFEAKLEDIVFEFPRWIAREGSRKAPGNRRAR
jgi:hypothetical protein